MKKLYSLIITIALLSFASPTLAASEKANSNACFGQDRAIYALTGDQSVGYWASLRKGENALINNNYRENCQISQPKLIDTVVIDPTSYVPTSSHIPLVVGKKYLFEVSGTYTNRNGSEQIDAEYVSEDNWLTKSDGLSGWPLNDYWNELDLMINNNFVDWLEKSPPVANTYTYNFIGNGSSANFIVFDGSPDTKIINEGWYSDNTGGLLTVKIYEI